MFVTKIIFIRVCYCLINSLFLRDDGQAFVIYSLWYEPGLLLDADRAKIMQKCYDVVGSCGVKSRKCDTI
jgi:hypothetical protein